MKDNQAISTSITFSAEQALEKLNAVNETLSKIATHIDKVIVNTTKASTKTKEVTKDIDKSLKNMNFQSVTNNLKNIYSTVKNMSEPFIDYIEDLNLLKVAFGDTADSARDMTDEIADLTGFDTSTLTRMTATYRQLTDTLGMGAKNADLLSTNLTKMALDVSSLYNLDLDTAASALQGAFTGQPRSIKAYTGANVTDEALQQELTARGIDRKTSSLNQGEKAIVTYLALERQLSNSNGDLANTINQPASMMRIFSEQIKRAAKNIGNLFIPVLQKVLPYLNAFLMVFSEIVEYIMGILGIDTESFWKDMSSGASKLNTTLDKTALSAKAALSGLRGFDKLNVIKTPSESSTSGGISGLNIDSAILDQLTEYDAKLDKIKSKATEIRDKTMYTLGFHKELNEETGKWEWVYGGIYETIKGLYKWFKNLNPKTKVFVGFMIVLASATVIGGIKKLLGYFGNSGLFKWISKAVQPAGLLLESIIGISETSLKTAVDDWQTLLDTTDKINTTILGAGGLVVGTTLVKEGIKDIADEGVNSANIIGTAFGGVIDGFSGALIGATYGGFTGGIIGLFIGLGAAGVAAIQEIDDALDTDRQNIQTNGQIIEDLYEKWQTAHENTLEALDKSNTEYDYYNTLWTELQNIVDENGKIKTGYEDRATFITSTLSDALGIEIDIVDGVIQKYDELKDEIDDLIKKKTAMIKLDALEEEAKVAIQNKTAAVKAESDAYKNYVTEQNKVKDSLEDVSEHYGIATDDLYDYVTGQMTAEDMAEKYNTTTKELTDALFDARHEYKKNKKDLQDAKEGWEEAKTTVDNYTQSIKNWEEAQTLALNEQYDELNNYLDHEIHINGKSIEEKEKYWQDIYDTNDRYLEDLERNRDKYSEDEYTTLQKSYTDQKELAKKELSNLRLIIETKNGEISKWTINSWMEMGEESEDEFIDNLSKLPSDIQTEVIDKMKEKGFEISDELQKGLDEKGVKITLDADTSSADSAINTFFNGITKKVSGDQFLENFKTTVSLKADGGFVDTGQMFVAREAGPELVGKIGNKTAVANNDQIVQAVAQGVASAITSSGGMGSKVVIEATGDSSGLMNFITFKQKEQSKQFGL